MYYVENNKVLWKYEYPVYKRTYNNVTIQELLAYAMQTHLDLYN